ncbi:uncharacterized protein LOC131021108 [Salvia miltiorrhiza]|uniref:uncharacterized protein LOC131021108 n=1 Tax=Salvia miltiorrhiza TaxID=226208 RepID=UPI0025ACE487|nr:uncharacterized protein LOC131021108 [Salvia miltiorrhiza]
MADGECQGCRSAPILVHHVPHLGVFSALCTACVLRHKPGSFCPVCFDTYDDSTRPAAHSRIMCLRCPALAHLTCLPSARSSRYLCPQCSDPAFSFIDSGPAAADGTAAVAFTKDFAKQHLCAAKIAAASMHRAAAVARADAEQKVMGALLARRNAKEAIERVAHLMSNQPAQDHSDVDDR